MSAAAVLVSFVLLAISQSRRFCASGRGGIGHGTGHRVLETFSFVEDRRGFRRRQCIVTLVARDVRASSTLPQSFCPFQDPPSLGLDRGLELSRAESHICEKLDVPFTGLGRADSIIIAASLRGPV